MKKKISIIIPVFNDAIAIKTTINAILGQKFDLKQCEIIIIDNGSTDDTIDVVSKFKDIDILFEHKQLASPYSARNRGIENSEGEIIVLLDATCCPCNYWLEEGVKTLERNNADIVAGNVLFDFQDKITCGKIYDSIINIKMKESVLEKQTAKTANLFIRREVFEKIGLFPEGVRSGADVRWTRTATQNRCKMLFSEEAYVKKVARGFADLIKKQWRVGLGQPQYWLEQDGQIKLSRYFKVSKLLPPKLK
ncbi:MAG: glycosyltransferase [Clostridia bacterium]|nr:glycosyltransferase [Clostridia bacterium]